MTQQLAPAIIASQADERRQGLDALRLDFAVAPQADRQVVAATQGPH